MKAVILAAGQGTRLRPLTNDKPKCLVEVAGKPLLEHQLAAMHACGLRDIHIVGGYRADQLDRPGITLHINRRFAETNMVATLFAAENIMLGESDLIITLSDQARDICLRNGFNLGSAGFNQCFNNTLATLNSQSIARRQAAIRNLQISNQMMNPPQAPIILTPPCIQQGGFCR